MDDYLSQELTQSSEMPFSRKRKYGRKKYTTSKRRKIYTGKSKVLGRSKFARAVMKVVNKNSETKCHMREHRVNMTLWHNSVQNITDNAFFTNAGVHGDASGTLGSRIGQSIYLKGIKVSMNLESQQYRPQVNYWLYLVRNRVNPNTAIANKSDMFEGISTTIPCDYIDKEKCQVLFCKRFIVKMPNSGVNQPMQQDATGVGASGFANKVYLGEDYEVFTNPQLCKKFYVPINKKIRYRDEDDYMDTPIGNWNYQWVIVSYDNYTTYTGQPGSAGYPCGHLSLSTKLIFTDV